jgi:hypothetical protein
MLPVRLQIEQLHVMSLSSRFACTRYCTLPQWQLPVYSLVSAIERVLPQLDDCKPEANSIER